MTAISFGETPWDDSLRGRGRESLAGHHHIIEIVQPEMLDRVVTDTRRFVEHRTLDMDLHDVAVQVLSFTTLDVLGQPDPAIAVAQARRANDFLAEIVAACPTRFAGLATLPMQDPMAAVDELVRSMEQLGLRGAVASAPTLGHYLDEARFDPIWAELERLGAPLFLHPNPALTEHPWEMLDAYPSLCWAMHHWAVDWATDIGGHALRVIFSGVFDRYPNAQLVLGDLGEFLPFQLSRLDSVEELAGVDNELAQTPSRYVLQNIAFTANGTCSADMLQKAARTVGADNLMFMADYPYHLTGPVVDLLKDLAISPVNKEKIAHRNAERLLCISLADA